MSPTLHLIRHAEGVHNLSEDNYGILDPELTDRGREQAKELAARLVELQSDGAAKIELVLASPMRRTLATALAAFEPQMLRTAPKAIHAWPDLQEVSDLPCDSGRALSVIQDEFGSKLVDFTLVEKDWELKQGKYANTAAAIAARALGARQWLKQQPYTDIAVVSHGCFLHFLTDDWEGATSSAATSWGKTELRSFTFVDNEGEDAVLVETGRSRAARGFSNPPPSQEEQLQLREATLKTWAEWELLKV